MSLCQGPNFHKEGTVVPLATDFAQLMIEDKAGCGNRQDQMADPCHLSGKIALNSLFFSRRLKNMQSIPLFRNLY